MKDIYTQFNEVLAEVDAAGKRKQFDERATSLTSVEAKINCAKFVLGVKAVKESTARPYVPKKNGSTELITESAEQLTETAVVTKKEALIAGLVAKQNMTLNESRNFLNLKPVVPSGLTKFQECEYRSYRKSGLSEKDALIAAKRPLRVAR
jgi:hypothetical protein